MQTPLEEERVPAAQRRLLHTEGRAGDGRMDTHIHTSTRTHAHTHTHKHTNNKGFFCTSHPHTRRVRTHRWSPPMRWLYSTCVRASCGEWTCLARAIPTLAKQQQHTNTQTHSPHSPHNHTHTHTHMSTHMHTHTHITNTTTIHKPSPTQPFTASTRMDRGWSAIVPKSSNRT